MTDARQRSGCLTAWLLFHALGPVAFFVVLGARVLLGETLQLNAAMLAKLIGNGLALATMVVIWRWRRWGLYVFAVAVALALWGLLAEMELVRGLIIVGIPTIFYVMIWIRLMREAWPHFE